MKKTFLPPLLALSLLLGGCLPENRFWWSPDGLQAAVLSGDALYLVKPDSQLGSPLEGGAADKSTIPKALDWLPDGKGFVLYRERKIASWEEMSALLPPAQVSKIDLLALTIPALLEGAGKLAGPSQDAETLLSSAVSGDPDDYFVALLCAYKHNKDAIGKLLAQLPKGTELLEKLRGEDSLFTLYEICLVEIGDGRQNGDPKSLTRSLYAMAGPKVSPKQNAVAWLQMDARGQSASLEISTLDGRQQITVSESVRTSFDWSPDGRSVIFAAPVAKKDDSLSKIQQATVIQESGALVEKDSAAGTPDTTPAQVELGMAILLDPPRLQVLPDGGVLFSSLPATLPCAGSGPEIDPKLYVLSADGKTLRTIATASGALPTNLSFFTTSPDGKLAAVVESGNDAVAVVDLATGAVEVISPAHQDWRCRTMPAWKSSSELTFAALGKTGTPEWMLWSKTGGTRPISTKWPAGATSKWLEKQDPKKDGTPAKNPA